MTKNVVNGIFCETHDEQTHCLNFIQIFAHNNYDKNDVLRHWDMWTLRDGVFLQVVAQ